MSIQNRIGEARERLRNAGLSPSEADLSARLLAEHLLGWSRERLMTDGLDREPDGFTARYDTAVTRRAGREPLSYITGEREFWGLALEVTPDVLIPRPETELIVEAVLDLFPDPAAAFSFADVCTGSGCVAVAIAHERPKATAFASDVSDTAVAVARRNAARHHVADRLRIARHDLLHGLDGPFDVITANPPYVRSVDREGLQPEVREEPEIALYGGADGLDLIVRLVDDAPSRLTAGGHVIFEFGLGQDVEIEEIIERQPQLTLIELRRDLQGIARTAVARKTSLS